MYTLYFLVTPGVNAHVFIDVGVWGDSWDFPVWFPDIALELPPGGVDFACHAGTICRRDYFYTADGHTDLVGDGGKAMADAFGWASAFERDWSGACASDACRGTIPELRRSAEARIRQAIQGGQLDSVDGLERNAESKARDAAYGSQDAVVTDAANAAKSRCADERCPVNLDALAARSIAEMGARRAGAILSWAEAEPIAVTGLAERIRVELINSKLRVVNTLRPDVPVLPEPTVQPPQTVQPRPVKTQPVLTVPIIRRPLPTPPKVEPARTP